MDFKLMPLNEKDLPIFVPAMKDSFNQAAQVQDSSLEDVLPTEDIYAPLTCDNAHGFKAVVDHEIVGGAIVQIDDQTHHNHLDFLYVDTAHQNRGIGYKIWTALEQKYPQTVLWETCTPYFDKRNIHFYINRCGFAAVEFYNQSHLDLNYETQDDTNNEMFRFEKRITLDD